MSDWSLADRLRLRGLAIGQGLRGAARGLGAPLRLAGRFTSRRPRRLLIAPQDIRTADPTVAADIYGGYFALGGKAVQLRGQSPFEVDPPSAAWSRNLMGFGWLRHLRAADTPLARANARALVTDWLDFSERRFPAAAGRLVNEPRVIARRIISWLSQSPVILDEATLPFYNRFIGRVAREAARLRAAIHGGLEGDTRILAAGALAQCSLCIEGFESRQPADARRLNRELKRQILADGGHRSRNPRLLAELLVDLLPLRQVYASRKVLPPAELEAALARMMPMLRLLRHGNGEVALFNGMGQTAPDLLATVLAHEDARAPMSFDAPQSGYRRRQAGEAVLLVDVGRAPPGPFSLEAHAGCLSFEFSAGLNRIVVNCGGGELDNQSLREATRATAAHSTLIVDETSSARFAAFEPDAPRWRRRLFGGPRKITLAATPELPPENGPIDAAHDGYAAPFGMVHRRRLALDEAGLRLDGEDGLEPARRGGQPGDLPYVLRFHLHPTVAATPAEGGAGVFLDLPGGDRWFFFAEGLTAEIEESIFLGGAHGPARCEQIVVRAASGERPSVAWALLRYNADDVAALASEAGRA